MRAKRGLWQQGRDPFTCAPTPGGAMLDGVRRTLSLIGLLIVGIALLANPVTGILGRDDADPVSSSVTTLPTTTTSLPGTGSVPGSTTTTAIPTTTSAPTATFIGPAAPSEFGDFVVEITVDDGSLVAVRLVEQPADRKSIRINDSAFPRYAAQAIAIQSADVDVISGATITWQALQVTLTGALELAGL